MKTFANTTLGREAIDQLQIKTSAVLFARQLAFAAARAASTAARFVNRCEPATAVIDGHAIKYV
jgi:hypothetical protein